MTSGSVVRGREVELGNWVSLGKGLRRHGSNYRSEVVRVSEQASVCVWVVVVVVRGWSRWLGVSKPSVGDWDG